MEQILAECSASISELQQNLGALIAAAAGLPVAILDQNAPAAYLIPAATYQKLMDAYDDYMLAKIVAERQNEKSAAIEVAIDDL